MYIFKVYKISTALPMLYAFIRYIQELAADRPAFVYKKFKGLVRNRMPSRPSNVRQV